MLFVVGLQKGRSADVAASHALRGYFDSLRAEVSRDSLRVTVVHTGGEKKKKRVPCCENVSFSMKSNVGVRE